MRRTQITTEFDLPDEIPIDEVHTLDQLTGRFQTIKDGVPELVKNAKDQYARIGLKDRSDRQIVIVANTKTKRLAVLDFAGAGKADFLRWRTWSDRKASQSDVSDEIEGGHGNGGKSFMVRGSSESAYIDSSVEGKRTRMGFDNEDPSSKYKPGYGMQGGVRIDELADGTPDQTLAVILKEFGATTASLPAPVQACFTRRKTYTFVGVLGLRDWDGRQKQTIKRLASEIPQIIADHGQAALSVVTCEVWVVLDGKLLTKTPIATTLPESYPGFEDLKIPVPSELTDPITEESISTGAGAVAEKYLLLRTSRKNLRMTEDLKARNVIRIWNRRNNVATWSVPALGQLPNTAAFVHGELRVPALEGEHLADAHRSSLADTPLTRALEMWTREQVNTLAQRLLEAQMAHRRPEDREKANRALSGLRELMRKYLEPQSFRGEDEGAGAGGATGDEPGTRKKRDHPGFGERIDEIVLEPNKESIALAVGTSIPIVVRCYEIQPDGKRKPVKSVPMNLVGTSLLRWDKTEEVLTALAEGKSLIRVVAAGVQSNEVTVETVACSAVDVLAPSEPLLQGQRVRILSVFHASHGHRDDLFIEATIDEPDVAIIGRHGFLTAGKRQGIATLRVRYGSDPSQHAVARIEIGPNRVPEKGQGGQSGSSIPDILFCGETAPGMDDYPKEQRSHGGGLDYPTIIEEPQFPHVVWINPDSKESKRVRQSRGGPSGISKISTQSFIHFVALKCFDILKRLRVRQEIGDRTITEPQFCQLAAQAEMDCAPFIDAAYELSEQLLAGKEEANQA